MVLVVVGVRPDTGLAAAAGAKLGAKRAIAVDRQMHNSLPDVFGGGDCVVTLTGCPPIPAPKAA
jgi:NADPH-dependent 2,4-dienoyl-CoA reductase/sulfur reductase-like enzyme